jgi:hypothetical protein
MLLAPDFTDPAFAGQALRRHGHAVLSGEGLARLAGVSRAELDGLTSSWEGLPPDAYLRDGGRYRRRRHACYRIDGEQLAAVPHRAHWQPVDYNALHGGIERWFDPVEPAVAASSPWARLLVALGGLASGLRGAQPWFCEAHQFRIDTEGGIGRPTPEGAHRDGVDLVAVVLVARVGVKGGETRVFDADGPLGQRFTLTEPWTTLLLDDARVIHETTPIQPSGNDGERGWRDTLVVTMRAGGFQGPAAD